MAADTLAHIMTNNLSGVTYQLCFQPARPSQQLAPLFHHLPCPARPGSSPFYEAVGCLNVHDAEIYEYYVEVMPY